MYVEDIYRYMFVFGLEALKKYANKGGDPRDGEQRSEAIYEMTLFERRT